LKASPERSRRPDHDDQRQHTGQGRRRHRRIVRHRRGNRPHPGSRGLPRRSACPPLDRITTLADELGNGSTAIEADVTDRDSIVAAAARVRQELGAASVLVNNAGVMLLGPFDSGQRADYRQMIEVNLLGTITATEVFLDQLKDGGGDIVNISSVAGRTARSGNGVNAATKWGINGWSESLRQELMPEVRVTLVEPGVVATELPSHITHADTKQGVQQLYDKAEVTPEDVAEIIGFILSRPRRLAINEILLRPAGQQ
jgi:NADP-dependent 3-hydroxy acid dehydrogenase YdfG